MGEASGTSPTLLLGRYRSEAVIGEGAFGRVERAFDTRLKRPVAIKTLKRSLARNDLDHFRQVEDRFVREAEAGARVGSHANLVTVYDLLEDDDRSLHLVLQFVSGGTIAENLASHGPFPLTDALRLTAEIARGLQAAHEAGIVHRDIKPANIFIAADGRAQVGDFGIAQLDHLSARTYASFGHPGTPLYMSPEQSQRSGYVRPTSDQYSVGLVLFEMLHGQPYKRLRDREIADFLATFPPPVAALIERMTAVESDDRFREMADVAQAIRRIEQSLDFDTISPIMPRRAAPPAAPPPAPADVEEANVPPAETPIPVRPVFVPSNPTPDIPIAPVAVSGTATAQPSAPPIAPSPPARDEIVPQRVDAPQPPTPEPVSAAFMPRVEENRGPLMVPVVAPPDRSLPITYAGGDYVRGVVTPAKRRSRGAFAATIGALLMVLIVGGFVAALRLNGGQGGGLATATAPGPVGGGPSPNEAALSATASLPTATAVVQPLVTIATPAPTATVVPTATVAVTPQSVVAPSPTVTPTAIPPTATAVPPTAMPVPSLGVFGAGTTDRGDLETLSPADAVSTFTVGQEVFAFVNYDGARPGVDRFDISVIANGAAQQPQNVTLQKPGGFAFVSLGKPAVGDYRIEVRHDGALLPNQPTFQVKAPPPTPIPAAPRTAPATGGQAPASQPQSQPQPASPPKSPTCAPGTC